MQAHLSDGSRVWGRAESLEGGKLTLRRPGGATLTIDWPKVVRLDVRSDRMAFCSDLEPASMRVTYPWEPMMDASVMGNPLRLGGKTYERGIGVHGQTVIRYDVVGRYDVFAAMIGIDDETEGRGDCVFRVVGDGKVLAEHRMTGKDQPRSLRVDISDVDRLELITEAGENLDIGDHANWADARFIRNP